MATKVLVTNISEQATEKTLRDFFTFCGEIATLTLAADPVNAGTQQATVEFADASSTQTALLLTNAMIVDRPITVVPLGAAGGDEIAPREGDPTKTSVLAKMFAAGYMLGDDAKGKAQAYDEKWNLTLKVKVGTEMAKVKLNEMDAKYGVSEKAGKAKAAVVATAKDVDEKLKISEKANVAKAQAGAVKDRAMQNATVQTAVATAQAIKEVIGAKVDALKLETQQRIEEKKRERAVSSGSAQGQAVADPAAQPAQGVPVAAPPAEQ